MIPRLFFSFLLIKSDVSTEMFIAIENQKRGKIAEAREFYDKYYLEYNKAEAFITKHIEFLLSIGDYESILRKYGHLNIPLIKKANECISILNSRNYRKISKLIDVSPFSSTVLKACIKSYLLDKNLKDVFNLIIKGQNTFPKDTDFIKDEAQYHCLNGDYTIGTKKLEDCGYINLAKDLKNALQRLDDINHIFNNKQKFNNLRQLYNFINSKTMSDNFTPSVFSKLLEDVLYKYVSIGIKLELSGLVSTTKTLYNIKNNEETRYFYLMSLVLDEQLSKASKELNQRPFSNTQYKRLIENKIEEINEKIKQEEEQKRQKQKRRERHVPSTNKAGTDFLGYYKLLGVDKNADAKKIKKAYVKIIAKNSRTKKTEKQKADWEKKHAQYNKAYQTLSDQKKRDLYDRGVDPESPQAQQGGHYQYEQNFKGFNDFGPFSDFFRGFNGYSGSFRQGSGTQYFYFN